MKEKLLEHAMSHTTENVHAQNHFSVL